MCKWIELFWEWCKISPLEYAILGMNQCNGEFEDEFPFFEEMILYAIEAVDKNIIDKSVCSEVITIMAFDNESERVLDYIVEKSSNEQVLKIIEYGIVSSFFNARWQIAELAFRRKPEGFMECLLKLSQDCHPYVRKRATNCIKLQEKSNKEF